MHIIEVSDFWPPETFVVRHIHAIRNIENLKISIFTRNKRTVASASVDHNSQLLNEVKYITDYRALYRLSKMPRLIHEPFYKWNDARVISYFKYKKPDLIHFLFSWYAVAFDKYLKLLEIPYTVGIRGSDIKITPLIQSKEYKDRLCMILSRASRLQTVCDSFHRDIQSLCENHAPIQTIRTCIPLPTVIQSHPEQIEKNRFITIARLHWVKGIHDLIRAMVFLPSAKLDIIGDGPEREHLTYLIHSLNLENRVRIHGTLSYESFFPLLIKATAYIQSSLSEGFSNSLAEAMALGKAVFVTAAGGTTELINDHENGIYIPIGNPQGIAETLKLATDLSLMYKIGQAARETAQKEFSMQKHAHQFADFFAQALERKHV